MNFESIRQHAWYSAQPLRGARYECGYCNTLVSASHGYYVAQSKDTEDKGLGHGHPVIAICPGCNYPSILNGKGWNWHFPEAGEKRPIGNLPSAIGSLYEEAETCRNTSSYTACVMLCRKLLMNIAVEKGAKPRQTFGEYVDYLESEHWLPRGHKWLADKVRKKGNDANHRIEDIDRTDADEILNLTRLLLSNLYEYAEPESNDESN